MPFGCGIVPVICRCLEIPYSHGRVLRELCMAGAVDLYFFCRCKPTSRFIMIPNKPSRHFALFCCFLFCVRASRTSDSSAASRDRIRACILFNFCVVLRYAPLFRFGDEGNGAVAAVRAKIEWNTQIKVPTSEMLGIYPCAGSHTHGHMTEWTEWPAL